MTAAEAAAAHVRKEFAESDSWLEPLGFGDVFAAFLAGVTWATEEAAKLADSRAEVLGGQAANLVNSADVFIALDSRATEARSIAARIRARDRAERGEGGT